MKSAAMAILAGLAALVGGEARAQPATRSCELAWRQGEIRQHTPLLGFDPAKPGPLALPQVAGTASAVVCHGADGLPEPKDYRVPAELKLPIGYGSGLDVVFLILENGQLELVYPETLTTPFDRAKADDVVAQMQDEMQAAGR